MACRCKKGKTVPVLRLQEPAAELKAEFLCDPDLPQCFLCALKHLSTAWVLFEEYQNGYPSYIKHLMQSLKVSEDKVRRAFLLYMKVQGHLNMAACELVGNPPEQLSTEILQVADKIREARLQLEEFPLYTPDFPGLLTAVQKLKATATASHATAVETSDKTL